MDYTEQSPVIFSVCPGMLGLERGIERAFAEFNWKRPVTAAYVEIEAFIIENLVQQMEKGVLDPAPIWSNIKTFRWEILRGKIDFFLAGYPCQPFSVSGQQKGSEDHRHLWPYIKEGIRTIKPVCCFFENVPGHINIGFREVKSDLESMGYRVKAGIYSAEEVGAPHQRKRLFILAIKRGNTTAKYASETVADTSSTRSKVGVSKQEQWEKGESKIIDYNSYRNWPSGPEEGQYEWEAPRVKSRMGFTINGYNFREDLLRMAGNGVVEQTAELAFKHLIKKIWAQQKNL